LPKDLPLVKGVNVFYNGDLGEENQLDTSGSGAGSDK
jgi:hypothetical protein